jgi:dienelactone hydrolase
MPRLARGAVLAEAPELVEARLPYEHWSDGLFTQLGRALDAMVLTAMRRVIDATLMPSAAELPEMRAAAKEFLTGDLQKNPQRYFTFTQKPQPTSVQGRYRRRLSGGLIIDRVFEISYRPYSPDDADRRVTARSDRVLIQHWMHEPMRPKATVLAIHGFSMGQPRIDAFAMFASQWFQRGLDVALLTLPYHGARTPRDARFSGERFAAPRVNQLSDAVRQAIYEMRMVTDWLREQTEAPVGLLGLSLGGYLSSLMAGLYDDLDFVVPMVPPVCIGDLAWRFHSENRRQAGDDEVAFSHEQLRSVYRVHSPLTYLRKVPKERILIVAGRGDRIVPPEHPHALWRHWGEPDIYWFSGSHLAPFRRQRIVSAIERHLQRTGVL